MARRACLHAGTFSAGLSLVSVPAAGLVELSLFALLRSSGLTICLPNMDTFPIMFFAGAGSAGAGVGSSCGGGVASAGEAGVDTASSASEVARGVA